MRTSTRTLATTAAVLTLALPLAACGSTDDDVSQPGVTSGPEESPTDEAPTDDATTDDATDEAPTDDETTDDETTDDATGGTTDDGANAGAFAAIDLAEAETGGTAFELDRQDGGEGYWEVTVAVDGAEIDVDLDLTGTEVLRTSPDGDVSRAELAALDLAEITMAEAIRIALDEVGGLVEEADIEEERSTVAWEVVTEDQIEVYVDVVTGEILEIDRD